jgi:hypothetical protein
MHTGKLIARSEWPLQRDHFNTYNARFWPISDRFASRNPPFSETYSGGGRRVDRPISARYMHAKEVATYEKENPEL